MGGAHKVRSRCSGSLQGWSQYRDGFPKGTRTPAVPPKLEAHLKSRATSLCRPLRTRVQGCGNRLFRLPLRYPGIHSQVVLGHIPEGRDKGRPQPPKIYRPASLRRLPYRLPLAVIDPLACIIGLLEERTAGGTVSVEITPWIYPRMGGRLQCLPPDSGNHLRHYLSLITDHPCDIDQVE